MMIMSKRNMIFNFLLFVGFIVFFVSCAEEPAKTEHKSEFQSPDEKPKRNVELKYFETEAGWGYDVIINGKDYIHQTHLPCECGGEGFSTKEKAVKAAEFLKKKIENYDRSLQITRAQLDSLGAL